MKSSFQIILLLISLSVFGQDKYSDSLKSVLKTTKSDTVKTKVLLQLAEVLPEGEWQQYNTELKNFLEQKLKFESNEKLKQFFTHYYCDALKNYGLMLMVKGLGDSAIVYYKKSLEISDRTGYKQNSAEVLTNLGRLYYFKGNIIQALNNYEASLKVYISLGNKTLEAFTYNVIADLYKDQDDYVKAQEYYQKAKKLNEVTNDRQGIAYSLNGLGATLVRLGKYDEAMPYLTESYEISKQEKNLQACAASLNDIGIIYREKKEYKKAIENFKQSYFLLQKVGYVQAIPICIQNIGSGYQLLGENDSALFYFNKSLNLATKLGFPDVMSYAYDGLYRVYKKQGKNTEALQMYKLSVKMHDSIYNDMNRKNAIRSQFKYEYEKKAVADSLKLEEEKKLTEAKLTQEKTQRYLLISGIILLLLVGFIILQRIKHNQKLNESRLRNKIASDLHDEVGSSLSSISMYAGVAGMNSDKNVNQDILTKIESTSRETIENMSDIVWSIHPKNDDFGNVLKRMQNFGLDITTPKNIRFEFNHSTGLEKVTLDVEQRKNLYLVYKEAVNNAVKYSEANLIEVNLLRQGKNISVSIKDNGKGMDLEKVLNQGNGLQNMKQRAKDINAILDIVSTIGKGTTIGLQLKTT